MLRKRFLIAGGVITALSPFLGIPHSWLMVLMPCVGVGVVLIAFSISLPVVRTIPHEHSASI